MQLDEHVAQMGVRLKTLKEQRDSARIPKLKDSLAAEERQLRETISIVETQLGTMKQFFEKLQIEINGNQMNAMEAFMDSMQIVGQRNSMKKMAAGLNLKDCGSEKLKRASERFSEMLAETIKAWDEEALAIGCLLMGIYVEPEATEIFESVWMTKGISIKLVWDANKKEFAKPPPGVFYSPDLEAFIMRAANAFEAQNAPNQTVFEVKATDGKDGRQFSSRVQYPYSYYYTSNGTQ